MLPSPCNQGEGEYPAMHIPTHILSGWCLANCFTLTARERFLAMAAASLADLDGISRIFGEETYWDYHHVVGHGLLFAAVMTIIFTAFSTHRLKAALLYFALTHVHLVLDYFGSGPNWPIHYLWPLDMGTVISDRAWPLSSWQNVTAAGVLLLWTLWIARRKGRTPVEWITPDLDRRLVMLIGGTPPSLGPHSPTPSQVDTPPL